MSPETRQLMDLHLGRSPQHYMRLLQEDTKFGFKLTDQNGLPSTVFKKACKEDVRGLFRIVLRYAFKESELSKRKSKIVIMSITYVFSHRNKWHLQY